MSTVAAQLHMPIVGLTPRSTEVKPAENTGSSVVKTSDLAAAIGQALARADLNNKQACAYMDIDQGLWTRQLQGDGHLSFPRLLRLPTTFWVEFLPLLAEPFGLSVSHEDMASRALVQAAATVDQLTRVVVQLQAQQRRPV